MTNPFCLICDNNFNNDICSYLSIQDIINLQAVSHYTYSLLNTLNTRLKTLNREYICKFNKYIFPESFYSKFLTEICGKKIIYQFIMKLIKTKIFSIGGSVVERMARNIFDVPQEDKITYLDSDIDIYCIGNYKLEQIQNTLFSILLVHFPINTYIVKCTRYTINIIFKNIKIQIITFVFPNLTNFVAFNDLTATSGIIKWHDKDLCLFITKLGEFSIINKCNIITQKLTGTSINRNNKYNKRGYLTILLAPGQILTHNSIDLSMRVMGIYDNVYCYFVDTLLSLILNVNCIDYVNAITSETTITNTYYNRYISITKIINNPYTKLFNKLCIMNMIKYKETEQEFSYVDAIYNYNSILNIVHYKYQRYNIKQSINYLYKYNERKYDQFLKLKKIVSIKFFEYNRSYFGKLPRIPLLFTNELSLYFLHKHGCEYNDSQYYDKKIVNKMELTTLEKQYNSLMKEKSKIYIENLYINSQQNVSSEYLSIKESNENKYSKNKKSSQIEKRKKKKSKQNKEKKSYNKCKTIHRSSKYNLLDY